MGQTTRSELRKRSTSDAATKALSTKRSLTQQQCPNRATSTASDPVARNPSTETTPPPKKKNEARPKQREQKPKINRPLTPNKDHGAVRVVCRPVRMSFYCALEAVRILRLLCGE